MSRAERLLELIQALRRHRRPVTAAALARELGVSVRTIYRDMASLQSQGADIEGEAGVGFMLRPGFHLPPMIFSSEEIEVLMLGARWAAGQVDVELKAAARNVIAKIAAVLPAELRLELESSAMLAGPARSAPEHNRYLAQVRVAIREERKLEIRYSDAGECLSHRTIWPFALGFFEQTRILVAWCELRGAIRHFRTDRISELNPLEQRYPRRRQSMLKQWRQQTGIADTLLDC